MDSPHLAALTGAPSSSVAGVAAAPAGPPQADRSPHVLVGLRDAQYKSSWRKRPSYEYEEAELCGSPCKGARLRMKSLAGSSSSSQEARVEFSNESACLVRCLWLDFESNEIPYTILQPGESKQYRTWADHAWIARDVASGRRMCLNGAQALVAAAQQQTEHVAITQPPALQWDMNTHRAFSTQFNKEVQTLLLCWQRLGVLQSGTSSADGGGRDSSRRPTAHPRLAIPFHGKPGARSLGDLPYDVVAAVIFQLAGSDTWQEATACCHPGIRPVQLHSAAAFTRLLADSIEQLADGAVRLLPASRRRVEEVVPVMESDRKEGSLVATHAFSRAPAPAAGALAPAPLSPMRALGAFMHALLGLN